MNPSHRLAAGEREQFERLGYLVREGVFDAGELERLRSGCERVALRVGRLPSPKVPVGSYLFQLGAEDCVMVKWEPDRPEVVQGIEPCAHLDEGLERLGGDARLVDPMRDAIGAPEVALFTEKLNLKRARVGGRYVLHQDYPYWVDSSEGPGEIATALICLDEASRENGCLEVAPGSHLGGVRPGRKIRGFGRFEMDPEGFDEAQLVSVEAPAGSVIFFGSLLVHRSTPNLSSSDRRALLYSYQPAGREHSRVGLAKLLGRQSA
jgi:hypothetical protein